MEADALPDFLEGSSQKERNEYLWACSFMKDPQLRFLRWLESKDIDPSSVSPRAVSRRTIWSRLKKRGLGGERMKSWRRRVKREMLNLNLNGLTLRTAQEISWWIVEECLEPFSEESKEPIAVDSEGMEFLPEWMRWVSLHPGLGMLAEDLNESMREQESAYEAQYPCPNQAARTMLNSYRGNTKQLDSFFKDCLKRHFEAEKLAGSREGTEEDADESYVNNLENVLLGLRGDREPCEELSPP